MVRQIGWTAVFKRAGGGGQMLAAQVDIQVNESTRIAISGTASAISRVIDAMDDGSIVLSSYSTEVEADGGVA
jgi:hypothetical protein